MFPSGGYFRGINCPFYSSGLCERAYCHFRHVKTEEEKPLGRSGSSYVNSLSDKPWNAPTSSSRTYSTETRTDEIQVHKYTGEPIKSDPLQDVSVSEKINKYTGLPQTNTIHEEYSVEFNHKNVTENKYKPQTNTIHEEYSVEFNNKNVTENKYKPQTLQSRKKNAREAVQYNKYTGEPIYDPDNVTDDGHDDASEYFPEYNPTPIDRLKRNSNGSKQKYTSGNPCTVSEQEYDPESNFSSSNTGRHAIKRTYSYDPTNPDFSHPIKKARDSGYEFDISKFSDDEDEEDVKNEEEEEEEEEGGDDKDKFPVIKDVKYFESLLINHRENGELKYKNVHNDSDKNSSHSISSVKKLKNNETSKKSSQKITDHSHVLKKSVLEFESNSKPKKSSKDLVSSGKNSQLSSSSKTEKNEKSKCSNSSQSASHSEKKTSSKSHSSKHSGHSTSSSSSNDKLLKDKHHSSSSKSSKSNASSSSSRASSSSKDKSAGKDKSSVKNKSHSRENSAKINNSSSDGKSHTSKEKKHSSDSQGKNGNILDKHKMKSQHHSSEHKRERTISSESDNAKKKILNINVNLFGEDSDTTSVGNAAYSNSSDDDLISVSDLEDEDAYEECLKIFNEHVTSEPSPKKKSKTKEPEQEEHNAAGKKRFAHKTDTQVTRKAPEKPVYKPSPAQVMHNRLLHMQKKALEEAEKSKAAASSASKAATSSSSSSSSSSSAKKNPTKESVKKREAHKPLIGSGTKVVDGKTVMATASKVEKRKAHTPNLSNLKRPTIPAEFGSKVPTNVRQRYLNAMIDECLKACNNEEKAFKRGQEEELAVYKRSTSKTVYLNVACNTIKRIRTEAAENLPSGSKKAPQSVMKLSHEAMLGGKKAVTNSYTLNRSGGSHKLQVENFSGAELYKRLMRYILTEEQLTENGFPRPDPEDPSKVLMSSENALKNKKANLKAYEKVCVRCGKKFVVYPNGTYANKEECVYHWGKAWKKKIAGYMDSRYTCCQGDLGAEGCQVGKYHVHEANKWENLTGYMKTLPCSPTLDGDYGVYAMDCEMVYTQGGLELARVTVTDSGNATVYETLIRPDRKVIDYNTRFSGITEEDMKGVVSTLRDAQAVLLSLFTDKTILIGHSLESDLSAIKLIHNTVVDTSVVFPHRLGPPYKRALKTLMAEYLQKIIQDKVGGHDSQEDAISCMELMQWRLKEDARKEPRRST